MKLGSGINLFKVEIVKMTLEEKHIAPLFFISKADHKNKNDDEMEVDYLLKWVQ